MPGPEDEFEDDLPCMGCGHPLRYHYARFDPNDERDGAYWHATPCEVNDPDEGGKCKCEDFA